MEDEELYHLIDLLRLRMAGILMNRPEYRVLSEDQKKEAILFDKELIEKLTNAIED